VKPRTESPGERLQMTCGPNRNKDFIIIIIVVVVVVVIVTYASEY
jgi:flagellar basal body-associated protein FliL